MSQEDLQKQADRADNIADQTVDEEVKKTLRDAARQYRAEAKTEECTPNPEWHLPREIT